MILRKSAPRFASHFAGERPGRSEVFLVGAAMSKKAQCGLVPAGAGELPDDLGPLFLEDAPHQPELRGKGAVGAEQRRLGSPQRGKGSQEPDHRFGGAEGVNPIPYEEELYLLEPLGRGTTHIQGLNPQDLGDGPGHLLGVPVREE